MNMMEVSFSATLDNENFARTTVGFFNAIKSNNR